MEFSLPVGYLALRRRKDKQVNTKTLLHLTLAMALLLTLPRSGQTSDADPAAQSAHLEQVSKGLVGRIGVAARLIGGTDAVTLNPEASFVMASTFKVAVAATLLDRVDRGEIRLNQRIDISPDMFVSGSGVIGSTFVHPGISLSVANLIEVMITESDNTATEICLRLAGGPAAVTTRLRALGRMIELPSHALRRWAAG
jgi:beta-lactamase class A